MLAVSAELKSLGGNLFVIAMVWVVVIVALQIIKAAMLKSAATAFDENEEKLKQAQGKARKSIAIASIAATAVAAIAALIFVVFQWNYNPPAPANKKGITPATVEPGQKMPSREEIEKAKKESADVKASREKTEEARKSNTEAMNDAIKTFRKMSNEATRKNTEGNTK